jgi:hypothetical protein
VRESQPAVWRFYSNQAKSLKSVEAKRNAVWLKKGDGVLKLLQRIVKKKKLR